MIALDANEIVLVSIGAIAAGFWGVVKASGTEIGKRAALKTKQKLHHALKVDSICLGAESIKAVEGMKSILDSILAEMKPDHGHSLKDAVIRLEAAVGAIQSEVRHIRASAEMASDSAGALLWRADKNGKVLWVSKAIKEHLGEVNDSSFLGWSWLNLIHHDDRERVRERWEEAIEDQSEVVDEYRAVGQGGFIYHVAAYARPVMVNGQVDGWQGSHRVVTVESPK